MRAGAAWIACAIALASCKKNEAPTPPADAQAAVVTEAAVPVPDTLLGEIVLRDPDAFWKRVQNGVGGEAMILQNTAAGVVMSMAGLDPSVAHEIDGDAPFYVAIGDAPDGTSAASPQRGPHKDDVAFAVAMKLKDPARAIATLFDAETARYGSKDVAGMRVLVTKSKLPSPLAAAVTKGGFFVVASSEADLAALAPYASRTMPKSPAPSSELEAKMARAGIGRARDRAIAEWGRAKAWLLEQDAEARGKHGNRPADFGDAAALVGCVDAIVQRRATMIGDLERAVVDVDAHETELTAAATLTPAAGDNAARKRLDAMHPGDALALLDAPQDAVLSFVIRDDAAERDDDARDIDDCASRFFGARLTADDKKKLSSTILGWAKGRGDWESASLAWSAAAHGVVVRAPAADGKRATQSLRDLMELVSRPLLSDAMKKDFGVKGMNVTQGDAPPLGPATAATFAREGKGHAATPPIGIAWAESAGEIDVAIGEAPLALLPLARPKAKLEADADVAREVRAVGDAATFALVARPMKATGDAKANGPPIVVAWGKRGGDGWGRAAIGYAILAEAMRRSFAP
jgi:hypothetical protein